MYDEPHGRRFRHGHDGPHEFHEMRGHDERHGHRHGPRPGRRGGGRGRAQRGDVRTAVLLLLADEPMHGYQLMQAIAERSNGVWRPSPGAIYPTLNQLEDEGLVTMTSEGGRKLVTLTDAGRAHIDENSGAWGDPFAEVAASAGGAVDLRELLEQLHGAMKQIGNHGSDAQIAAAAKLLAETRRSLYLILADDPGDADE